MQLRKWLTAAPRFCWPTDWAYWRKMCLADRVMSSPVVNKTKTHQNCEFKVVCFCRQKSSPLENISHTKTRRKVQRTDNNGMRVGQIRPALQLVRNQAQVAYIDAKIVPQANQLEELIIKIVTKVNFFELHVGIYLQKSSWNSSSEVKLDSRFPLIKSVQTPTVWVPRWTPEFGGSREIRPAGQFVPFVGDTRLLPGQHASPCYSRRYLHYMTTYSIARIIYGSINLLRKTKWRVSKNIGLYIKKGAWSLKKSYDGGGGEGGGGRG